MTYEPTNEEIMDLVRDGKVCKVCGHKKKASEAPVVDQPGWMRGAEAARYAAVSRRTLSEWMRRRMIPFLKVSHRVTLFRRADLDRALLRFTVKSAGPEL